MARSRWHGAWPWVGLLGAGIARWLRADTRDVVRVLPGEHPGPAVPEVAGPVMAGLVRWRPVLRRRRAVVLVRRQLSVALGIGVVVGIIALATGSSLRAGPTWWAAAFAALAAGLAGVIRRPLGAFEVARLLDRDLALDERIGTALEIESPAPTAHGLAAVVVSEANVALTRSLRGGARAACRPAPREWASLAALAAAFLLLLVLPEPGAGSRGPTDVSGATKTGHAGVAAKVPAHRTATSGARRADQTASATRSGSSAPLRLAAAQPSRATHGEFARTSSGPPVGRGLSKLIGRGGAVEPGGRVRGGSARTRAGTTADSLAAATGQSTARGGTERATGRAASSTSGSHTAVGRSPATRVGGSQLRSGPQRTGAATSSAAARGVISAKHAQAGGESVGRARGTSALVPRPPPRLATAAGGLLIQSGYAPGQRQASSRNTGRGSAAVGGSGAPRAASFDGGGDAGAVELPYIPSSPSAVSSLDESLLLSYFSAFSWFSAASW